MEHCFTYGSLMCEDIMAAVSGASCASSPARLADYRRRPVAGETYPGIVPASGQGVDGVLYFDLPPSAWPRLDRFEGDEYERRQVEVRLPDGRVAVAWTYIFRPEYAHRLLDADWDFERFLRTGKARFTARFLGEGSSGA